ncbi:hypothetical protein BH09ACT10_BH09ACT10_10910 [soil metagenome]
MIGQIVEGFFGFFFPVGAPDAPGAPSEMDEVQAAYNYAWSLRAERGNSYEVLVGVLRNTQLPAAYYEPSDRNAQRLKDAWQSDIKPKKLKRFMRRNPHESD